MTREQVQRAMQGDRQAFGELVSVTYPTVSAIALAITRDRAVSEDVVQDVFLTAWLALRRLRNPESFLPWLRQITRHIARSAARQQGRRATREVEVDTTTPRAAHAAGGTSPDESVALAEKQAALAAAIEALPDDTRECVLLYYYEGLSAERVAALLGLSPEAVRKRLERARRTLREDVVSRLGLGLHEARTRAVTGILALLGTPPTDPQALLLTAGLGTAALPPAAVGGAAIGVAGSVAGLWNVSRRLGGKVGRRLLGVGTLATLALVAVLPLTLPRLVWLWFLVAQGGVAVLMFHTLPRHGIRPTRWAVLAWLLAAAAGAVAIVWAMGRMS